MTVVEGCVVVCVGACVVVCVGACVVVCVGACVVVEDCVGGWVEVLVVVGCCVEVVCGNDEVVACDVGAPLRSEKINVNEILEIV